MKKLLTIMAIALALTLFCGIALADTTGYDAKFESATAALDFLTECKVGGTEYFRGLQLTDEQYDASEAAINAAVGNHDEDDTYLLITVQGTDAEGKTKSAKIAVYAHQITLGDLDMPTCTEGGKITGVCVGCDKVMDEVEIDPLGHIVAEKEPEGLADLTCGDTWHMQQYCLRCGEELGDAEEEFTIEHEWTSDDPAYSPTVCKTALFEYYVFKNYMTCKPAADGNADECDWDPAVVYLDVCKKCGAVAEDSPERTIPLTSKPYYEAIMAAQGLDAEDYYHQWNAWVEDAENPANCWMTAGATRWCDRCNIVENKLPEAKATPDDPQLYVDEASLRLAFGCGYLVNIADPTDELLVVSCKGCTLEQDTAANGAGNEKHHFTLTLGDFTYEGNPIDAAVLNDIQNELEALNSVTLTYASADYDYGFSVAVKHGELEADEDDCIVMDANGDPVLDGGWTIAWDDDDVKCGTQKGVWNECPICGCGTYVADGNVKQHELSDWYKTFTGSPATTSQWTRFCTVEGCTYKEVRTQAEKPTPCEDGLHPEDQLIVIPAVASTCTTPGTAEAVKCGACGAIVEGGEALPLDPAAHTVDEETCEVIKEASCKEDGLAIALCAECGEAFKVVLPKTEDHVWGEPVVVPATYEADGSSTITCSVCGLEEVTVLPKLDKPAAYKLVDVKFEDGILSGKLEHVEDTLEAAEKGIRVTFFHNDNTYVTVAAMLYSDGTFEAEGAGAVEHITVAAYAVEKVVNPDNLTEDNWFGSARVDVK